MGEPASPACTRPATRRPSTPARSRTQSGPDHASPTRRPSTLKRRPGRCSRQRRAPVRQDLAMPVALRAAASDGPTGIEDGARRARELGVMGWVRAGPDTGLLLHAEGDAAAIEALL